MSCVNFKSCILGRIIMRSAPVVVSKNTQMPRNFCISIGRARTDCKGRTCQVFSMSLYGQKLRFYSPMTTSKGSVDYFKRQRYTAATSKTRYSKQSLVTLFSLIRPIPQHTISMGWCNTTKIFLAGTIKNDSNLLFKRRSYAARQSQ